MIQEDGRFTQKIALFLVVFGIVAMCVASHFHWPEVTTAGAGVVGGGLGIITNNLKSNVDKAGTVNIDAKSATK